MQGKDVGYQKICGEIGDMLVSSSASSKEFYAHINITGGFKGHKSRSGSKNSELRRPGKSVGGEEDRVDGSHPRKEGEMICEIKQHICDTRE